MEVVLSKILADVEANAVSPDIILKVNCVQFAAIFLSCVCSLIVSSLGNYLLYQQLKDAMPSIKSMTVAQKNSSYKKAVKLYNVTRRSDNHFDLRLLCCQVIAWTKIETSKVLDVFRWSGEISTQRDYI